MKKYFLSALILGLGSLFALVNTSDATTHRVPQVREKWRLEGFKQPESAVYDAKRRVIFVSNINGDPTQKDGNGFVSQVSASGKIQAIEWVKGLDAPKGLGLRDDSLFVADIGRVVEIDILSAKIVKSYPIAGTQFLNDITVNEQHVFVSDMLAGKIYSLAESGKFESVPVGSLAAPNGLTLHDGHLVIANWGIPGAGFVTKVPGHVVRFDPKTSKSVNFGDGKPLGNLDGIEADGGGGFWLTDWMKGDLLHLAADGSVDLQKHIGDGAADLGQMVSKHLLLVPLMGKGEIVALKTK